MTPEELQSELASFRADASVDRQPRLTALVEALSAKLQEKEYAELIADAERERAKALDERNAQLVAKLRDVEEKLKHVESVLHYTKEAQRPWEERCAELAAERDVVISKLQEVQAERDDIKEEWEKVSYALKQTEVASRGEVVKACPSCGAHEPKGQDLAWIVTGRPMLVCAWCRHQFAEPALWQRVGGGK